MTTLYMDSVALAADVRLLMPALTRKDQALARRLKRLCDELPKHISEGMSSTGRARRSAYAAALGSAREALACVRAALSVGYLNDPERELEGKLSQLVSRMVESFALAA
jgi:four helix bundle protein